MNRHTQETIQTLNHLSLLRKGDHMSKAEYDRLRMDVIQKSLKRVPPLPRGRRPVPRKVVQLLSQSSSSESSYSSTTTTSSSESSEESSEGKEQSDEEWRGEDISETLSIDDPAPVQDTALIDYRDIHPLPNEDVNK